MRDSDVVRPSETKVRAASPERMTSWEALPHERNRAVGGSVVDDDYSRLEADESALATSRQGRMRASEL